MSRDKYNISSLAVDHNSNRAVQNTFFRQPEASNRFALIYPGLRYSCDKPLLHYTTEILLDQGYDILQLWTDYKNPEFQDASQAEQTIRLIEDGKALLQVGIQSDDYSKFILVGKSLGTLTMAFILSEQPQFPELMTIWFTPLFYLPPVSNSVLELSDPAFVVGSSADQTFDSDAVNQLADKNNIKLQVYEDADHSLEVPGDPLQSTKILSSLVEELNVFLG
jgi:hypothetical protein